MKKSFLFLFLLLNLLYSQIAFSSSSSRGMYYTPSLSTENMNKNMPRLRNEFMEYNATLPSELQSIQRNNMYNRYYNTEQSTQRGNSLYQNYNTYEAPQIQQRNNQQNEQLQRSTNPEKKENATPKWWRQENSFEGWGFD